MQDEETPQEESSSILEGDGIIDPADPDATQKIIDHSVLELWNIVDTLSRVRPERQRHYRVTIFGSARLTADHPVYADVRRLARELAALGCDIVTGGGPGLMQAANEGEKLGDQQGRTRSIGLRVDLEFEQNANPFVEHLYHHGTFFSRLHHFVRLSSAYVVVPGGIGTLLELTLVWQLLQVRKLHGIPLILMGSMWHGLTDWARDTMAAEDPPMASAEDVDIPTCVDSVDEVIQILKRNHAEWKKAQENA